MLCFYHFCHGNKGALFFPFEAGKPLFWGILWLVEELVDQRSGIFRDFEVEAGGETFPVTLPAVSFVYEGDDAAVGLAPDTTACTLEDFDDRGDRVPIVPPAAEPFVVV